MSNDRTVFRFSEGDTIQSLLDRNQDWSQRLSALRPGLFPALGEGQSPQILWIGCSDSRVPETSLLDLLPGEVFVHRNIANLLPVNDLSSLSVIHYAVGILGVKHVIICGHTGCGGVMAALDQKKHGLVDIWLQNLRAVRATHSAELDAITDKTKRVERLVELNVMAQVHSAKRNETIAQAIAERGLQVHGFVYDVGKGLARLVQLPNDPHAEVFALKN